jgi:hypothetical protein
MIRETEFSEERVLELAKKAYEEGDVAFDVIAENARYSSSICKMNSSNLIGHRTGSLRPPGVYHR